MTPAAVGTLFFAQLAAIVAASRGIGWIARRLGQPQVVGEMIAGVLLGPSLFGLIAPHLQAALFPAESRGLLYAGGQLGVGLYMFLVGLSFRTEEARGALGSASAVALSGMAAPFVAAIALAPWLMTLPGLFAPTLARSQAILFLGACIGITAFPMLARIIHERGLAGTRLGTLALTAGAVDDAVAWMVLAIVLATFGGGAFLAIRTIGGAALFALVLIAIAPRALARFARTADDASGIGQGALALALLLFLIVAWAMDAIGMHAVFGGFLLGIVMPRGRFARELAAKLEPFTVVVLLPMFFTNSGLNTRLDLVAGGGLLGATATVLAASMLAKGGACWAAARLTGQDNPTALGIAALMNARGLMELIIINIGLQRGLIGPALFAMLVLMAVLTTLMASPLFELAYGRRARAEGRLARPT